MLEVTAMRARGVRGFTLIELLVVITIAGVMLAIGIPSFREFIASQRVKSASYELATSLLMARSEAIKRRANVTVAPVTADTWTSGWNVTAGGGTVQSQQELPGMTITTAVSTITFQSTGRPTTTSVGTFEITSNGKTRCVRLDSAGSASTSTGACS